MNFQNLSGRVDAYLRMSAALLSVLFFSLLTGCSTVKVRTEKRVLTKDGIASAEGLRRSPLLATSHSELAAVGESCSELLRRARQQESFGKEVQAAACYLKAAVTAREQIVAGNFGPTTETRAALITVHNKALAKFGELWSTDPRRWEDVPHLFTCGEDTYQVVLAKDSDYSDRYFDRAIASDSIRGEGVIDKQRDGFGASLVAIRDQLPGRETELEYFPERGMHLPISLTVSDVQSSGPAESLRKVVSISLLDPVQRQSVLVGNTRLPLAADFSAPMELVLKGRNETLWGLKGFLNGKKRAEISGIYLMEPYDPNRIPVILVHGLISVPIIWRDIVPEFLSEPEIASRYQVMVFAYPSSYAVVDSALLFRNELRDLRERYDSDGNDPLSTNMVVMGHSMGGILSHLLVADMKDHLWKQFATVPLDQLPIPEQQREHIRARTFFDYDPAVNRAVFMSTPHGGASMATMSLADSVSRLARLPTDAINLVGQASKGPPVEGLKVDIRKKITSVQSLRPDSPIVLAMKEAPYKEGVVYHSIIGDQGKGDTPDSSDGVVEYWSSHQPGAASELIVPTDHGSYKDPNAIEELKRILRVHAGLPQGRG